jgi:hypothetical protein
MFAAGPAYIAGLAPFTDKGVVPGTGAAQKRDSKKFKGVSAADPAAVMPNYTVCYHKALILKTEPFAAPGAVDGINPVADTGNKTNT